MTIAFMGGEMGAFTPSDSTPIEAATVSRYDPSFARCAMSISGSTAYVDTPSFTAIPDCYTHFDISLAGSTTTATKSTCVELRNDSDVAWVRLTADWNTSSISTFSLDTWNGSAWTSQGTVTLAVSVVQTMDIRVVSNTASGSVKLYVGGTARITSGTVDLSSFTGVAKVRTYGRTIAIRVATYISQLVVSSVSTIGGKLFTVPVSGAGASSDWTGSSANIDEIAYSDADFINSGAANQVSTFAVTNPTLTGYTVLAVGVAARANCGAAGPQNLQLALKSGATTYFSASKLLDAGYGAFVNIWETDPATSSAWVNTAVLLLQPGVKSIA